MSDQEAEVIAVRAVEWLAGADEPTLARFFSQTGACIADFARVGEDEGFRQMVLDFVLGEDRRVIEFCDAFGYPCDRPYKAFQHLLGGSSRHWT